MGYLFPSPLQSVQKLLINYNDSLSLLLLEGIKQSSLRGCLESVKQVIFILGNREQGTGNREQGTGNREQGAGNGG